MSGELLFAAGFILILVGLVVILVAASLLFFRALREKGHARGAGLVMIGPFPMVFGTDRESVKVLLLLSIALIVLVLILSMFAHRLW